MPWPGNGFDPVEALRGRIDLIVMLAIGVATAAARFPATSKASTPTPTRRREPKAVGCFAIGLFLGSSSACFELRWRRSSSVLAEWPAGASAAQLYGTAILTGIGF